MRWRTHTPNRSTTCFMLKTSTLCGRHASVRLRKVSRKTDPYRCARMTLMTYKDGRRISLYLSTTTSKKVYAEGVLQSREGKLSARVMPELASLEISQPIEVVLDPALIETGRKIG